MSKVGGVCSEDVTGTLNKRVQRHCVLGHRASMCRGFAIIWQCGSSRSLTCIKTRCQSFILARPPNAILDPSVFCMNCLPRPKVVVNLAICGRQDSDHATCRPVDVPLLSFADDVVGLARTPE